MLAIAVYTVNMLFYFCFQIDIFSYGVMLVHVLSGEWPFPGEAVRVNPRNPNDPNDIVGVTEFDRREEHINKIDNQHPLMHLIQSCLSNSPSHRPTSCEVHQQVSAVSAEHPASFTNRVEILERIKVLGEEKEAVRMEKSNAVAEKDEQITELRREKDEQVSELRRKKEQVSAELEETQSSIERLKQSHLIELEGMQLENNDLKAEIKHVQDIVCAKEQQLHMLKNNHASEVEEINQTIQKKIHLLRESYEREKLALEEELCLVKEESAVQLTTLEDEYRAMKQSTEKNHQVQLEFKSSELSLKDALISSKTRTVQSLQEKLRQALGTSTAIMESLNVFSPGMRMNFTKCAKLPLKSRYGQAIVVDKQVYVVFHSGIVLKYVITEDSWSTLPKAPVEYFSIGCLYHKIILIGGQLQSNAFVIRDIHEFDEATQQWVRSKSISPMPTARQLATAVSWTSPPALIVCGGEDEEKYPLTVVEVYHSRTSQWHTASPLPFPRDSMTHTVIHCVLYLFGGYEGNLTESYTRSIFSTSIPRLLESCLQPSRTPPVQWQSGSIPDVPHYWSSAASLGGCLLAMGGVNVLSDAVVSSVHAYCPSSSSWVCVGQLPQPLAVCTTVILPTGELLVLGGVTSRSEGEFITPTYKCCLSVEP